MLFRLFVNMHVSFGSGLACYATIRSGCNSTLRMLGYSNRQRSGPLKLRLLRYCLLHLIV